MSKGRVVAAAVAGLLWLNGCETSVKLGDMLGMKDASPADPSPAGDPTATGSVIRPAQEPNGGSSGIVGKDPYDEVSLGKKYYHAGHFGIAEKHFRKAVEESPRDAEAWVGLAACYDRLKRFELADRAYDQAIALVGETPEIMNNRGYSYILRGDYVRARSTLLAAQAQDPANPYIKNNLALLAKSADRGKAVR
jgi:tetratricopeptide (TPR) repeat protein